VVALAGKAPDSLRAAGIWVLMRRLKHCGNRVLEESYEWLLSVSKHYHTHSLTLRISERKGFSEVAKAGCVFRQNNTAEGCLS